MKQLLAALIFFPVVAWAQTAPVPPAATPASVCSTHYYPPAAVRAGAEGTAIVSVHIDEAGAVSGVDLLQSTGNDILDKATVICVTKAWHFRPAQQNGKPVAVIERFTIPWSLRPDAPAAEAPASSR